jgi:cytochrome P450 PksS
MIKPVSLQSADLHERPHEIFAWMRREQPVHRGRLGRRDLYFVSRYADVEALLGGDQVVKDPAHSSLGPRARRMLEMPSFLDRLMTSMITSDDPEHRRLRRLVAKAFTPRTIAELEPAMEATARRLVAALARRGGGDLIEAFALPFPVHVITELVGVPVDDRPRFQRWIHGIVRRPGVLSMLPTFASIWSFVRYLRQLIERKRREPADDLFSALVHVQDQSDRLSEDELVAMAFLLLTAGHETTVSLIANGTLALLDHPDELERLRAHPELMPSAIEEFLRYDGPLLTSDPYYARETFTLHDVVIPAGATVLPAVMSANRDEAVFERPDALDLGRTPNRHLTFGKGLHHCIGAPLARLEARIAFTVLLAAAPTLRLASARERIRHRHALFLNRLEALPVTLA